MFSKISGRGVASALKMTDESGKKISGSRVGENLSQKSLQPFICREKGVGNFAPLICYDENDVEIHGYKDTLFTTICRIYLKARRNIHLSPRQRIIAAQSEIIIDSLADLGITALVDEATGYNKIRKERLQLIFNSYISEKISEWEKTFQDDFYQEIFRLWNLPSPKGTKRPSFIGILTNKYVYNNLPEGLLEELKKKIPKTKEGKIKGKLHQWLTEELGKKDLTDTLRLIVWFLSVSEDKEEFKKLEKKYRLKKKSLYAEVDRKVEKEKIKEDFDRKFKALLSVPPEKDE
jgi:P63C domain